MTHATIENLEARCLLSGTEFGINLDINDYWRTAAMWVNSANELAPWGTFNNPGAANPSLTYSPNGYPLQNASTYMLLKGYPDGIYKLSYQGSATVTVSGMGQIVAGTQITSGNLTTADVLVNHSAGGQININVSNINPNNPIDAVKLIMPGYAADTTQVFNQSTIQRLAPFGILRPMDMLYGNINNEVNWSDRVKATDFLQTGSRGVAYEDLIALANETHNDLWLNVPVNATNDYIQHLADLTRDTLDPSLKVYIEYGNELWHNAFYAGQTSYNNAQANPALTSSYGNGRAGQQEAFKLKAFHDIFAQEFDPQNNNPAADARFGFIFEGAPDINDRFNTEAFSFMQQKYGGDSFLTAYSRAMYLNLTSDQDVAGLTMDQLFADLEGNLPSLATDVAAAKSFANQNYLQFFIYEGGQGLEASNFINQNLKIQAQSDARMGVVYQQLFQDVEQIGVDLFLHYAYIDSSTQFGSWGLMESADLPGSVKWDQVLDTVLTPGDANLDGTVNYADFLVFQNTYQATQQPGYVNQNLYWQQGDFNQDRYVTAADYFIWKANATGLTPQQLATVAAFEATLSTSTPVMPAVTVVASDSQAVEAATGVPADPGTFTFARTGDLSQPLTVNFRLAGSTAANGTDYQASPNLSSYSATFASGSSTVTVTITPLADTIQDPNETVLLTLYTAASYTLGINTSAMITIADNTPPGAPVLLAGTVIGTTGSYQNNGNTKEKSLDGNTSTIFDGPGPDGNWVGLDLGSSKVITSISYYPRASWASRMVGGKFQGSNTADFSSGVVNLYTITTAPAYAWTTVAINNPSGFRYIRYLSPNGSYGDVAELQFYGKDADSSPPSQPGLPMLVSKTDTTISLNWTASTDNVGVTRYDVFRNNVLVGSPTTNSFNDIGLTASTPYIYTVKAYDAAGNSTSSNPGTITTNAPPDRAPPSKPGVATLIAETDTTINFSWIASTDNVGIARYDVYRNNVLAGSPTSNSFTDIGLTGSTPYSYTVIAYDAAGNPSATSDATIFTTNASPDVTPPAKPGAPTLVSKTDTTINFNWTASIDNVGVTRYDICRNGVLIGSSATNSFTDTGRTASTIYSYTVVAYDAAGNHSSLSDSARFMTDSTPDLTPPSQPGAATLTSNTDTTIAFNWAASVDNVGVTRYDVYRNNVLVGSPATNSFADIGLTGSTAYSYTIIAYDAAGNPSATSNAAILSTNAPVDLSPPSTPGTPAMVGRTDTSISLSWTASTDNVGVIRYDVFRNGSKVASSATASYTDIGLTASSSYSYTVQAFDAAGNPSTVSQTGILTTNPPPGSPTLLTGTVLGTSGSYNNSGNTRDKVFDANTSTYFDAPTSNGNWAGLDLGTVKTITKIRYTARSGWASRMVGGIFQASNTADFSSGVVNLYTISASPSGTVEVAINNPTGFRYVRYLSPAGSYGNVAEIEFWGTTPALDVAPPSTPGMPTLTSRTDTTITLNWTASTDNVGVTRYDVFRNGNKVGSSTTASYTDIGLTGSSSYSYTVQAVDAAGNFSALSPAASLATIASAAKLTGTVIGTTGSYNNGGNTRDRVFDGDINTYFDAPTANGNWVGLDLGSAKTITKIRFYPRTNWASRMVGGIFQASSTADFSSGMVNLYTVTASPSGWVEITFATPVTLRYFRYLSPNGSYGNVSDIEVWGF